MISSSPFADVTQLTMAEFDKACTSLTTELWLMYMVMILKRYTHAERAGMWDEHMAEVENMFLYLVCILPQPASLYLAAMIGLPTLALNILKALKMERSLYVKQKLSSIVYGET